MGFRVKTDAGLNSCLSLTSCVNLDKLPESQFSYGKMRIVMLIWQWGWQGGKFGKGGFKDYMS